MRRLQSLRFQLLVIVLVCYLFPTLLLGEYMGRVFFDDLRQKTEAALTSGAEHARTLALQSVNRAVTLAKDATYDGELTNVYAEYAAKNLSDAEFLRFSRGYLERKYSRESLFTFAAYFPVSNPDLLVYNRAAHDQAIAYQQNAHVRVVWLGETLDTQCLFLEAGGAVYLVRNLMNLKMERFGMLVLGVNRDVLLRPLDDLAASWGARLDVQLGRFGATELDWPAFEEGLCTLPGEDKIVYTRRTENRDYPFCLRLTIDQDRLYGEMRAFRRLMAGLFVLLLPVMAAILWYARKRIVRPIALLSQASRRIEAGELGVTVPMHGNDELGDLGRAFTNMSTRIAELIDKTYKEEIALRDARIQAMQSRINPHFLNNALESINWQARLEGSQAISAMVESLSVLLNASMARANRRMVPLSEEAEVARAYLHFVRLRFGDKLTVACDIAPDALLAVVPLLTLQPLLENASEHGIAPAGGGYIGLSCALEGDALRVEVVNTGRPMSAEDHARVEAALRCDNQNGAHLGLCNIITRLRLIYGDRAEIAVFCDENGKTVARLRIPLTAESALPNRNQEQQKPFPANDRSLPKAYDHQ